MLQALEQLAGWFVVRVLWHQFATEGFGQKSRGHALGGGLGRLKAGFEAVGEGEQNFDTAEDLGLLFHAWNGYGHSGECYTRQMFDR